MSGPYGCDPELAHWRADPAESELCELTLSAALSDAAHKWPDRYAYMYLCQPGVADIKCTYAELDGRATRLAAGLLNAGYRPGDAIAVWAPNDPAWIDIEFACSRAGLTLVALNPLYRELELEFALRVSGAVAVFHGDVVTGRSMKSVVDAVLPKLPKVRGAYAIKDELEPLLADSSDGTNVAEAANFAEARPDELFMIQFTSGTTGDPKATMLSPAGILTTARNIHIAWQVHEGDRVCHGFPQFHIGGSGCMTPGAILSGSTTLPLYIFKANVALDVLERAGCSTFIGVPTQIIAMLEDPTFTGRSFPKLQRVVMGGSTVPEELIRRCERALSVEVINSFGMTETSSVCISVRGTDSTEKKSRTVGVAMPGVSFKVVDEGGKTLPHDQPGELCYSGPGRTLGYLNADASRQVIDADGWLHTGDRASMDAEGYITILGRTREMINRGGENLSPTEIESYLLAHEAVAEVAVVGVPDAKYGEEVCAVVRLAEGRSITGEELRDWCRGRISRWKVPRYVSFVSAFPMTASGKVQKFKLRKQMAQQFAKQFAHD